MDLEGYHFRTGPASSGGAVPEATGPIGGSSIAGGAHGLGSSGGSSAAQSGGVSPSRGGSPVAGGHPAVGGSLASGSTNSGGSFAVGGTGPLGGMSTTGGFLGNGGTPGIGGAPPGGNAGVGGTVVNGGTGGCVASALSVTNGYLGLDSNCYGLQGSIYTYGDGYSTIAAYPLAFPQTSGSSFCVRGNGYPVPYDLPEYYNLYWGAGWGLNLNQGPGLAPEDGYPASSHGVVGFRFTLTNHLSSIVRLVYAIVGEDTPYCFDHLPGGEQTVLFSQARQNCWEATSTVTPTALQKNNLRAIQWQIPTQYAYATPFDFCVYDLTPITAQMCTPNALFCDAGAVRHCSSDGLTSTLYQSCLSGQYCEATSATCRAQVCSPNLATCNGTLATTCNADGSGYLAGGTDCASRGQTCSTGTCTGGPYTVYASGYISSGPWYGYAWPSASPAVSSTITPAAFSALAAGSQLCVSGTVAATTDFSSVAMLGINLAQVQGTTTTGTWTPTGSAGLSYSLVNTGGSPLRIQIQGTNAATDASQRWCYQLTASSATIPWSSFNTQCWVGGTGIPYANSALSNIIFLVPGGNIAATPFNFCIVSLSPV